MTFARIKTAGWAVNEQVSSAQLNALDIDHKNALDKTSAGDTLSGVVQLSGSGRIVGISAAGADMDGTYSPVQQGVVYLDNTITADRVYTLITAGAHVTDRIVFRALASMSGSHLVTVKDDAGTALITLGTGVQADATWAEFVYLASHWRLIASGKQPNRIVACPTMKVANALGQSHTGDTAFTDIPELTATLTTNVGDLLFITGGVYVSIDAAGTYFTKFLAEGTALMGGPGERTVAGADTFLWAVNATYTVVSGGSVVVKAQYALNSAARTVAVPGPQILSQSAISVLQVRP